MKVQQEASVIINELKSKLEIHNFDVVLQKFEALNKLVLISIEFETPALH